MVQSIHSQLPVDPTSQAASKERQQQAAAGKDTTGKQTAMDTVTLSRSSETSVTYTPSVSPEQLAERSYDMLRQLVTNMLKEQGIDYKIAVGETTIDISEISQEEAQELISEDGYFGVEQTSDRIVDFAIAAAGGDVSKLGAIKEGVEQGFNEALDAFGGWLPDISYDTLDAVMEKLDAWAAEADGEKTY